MKQILLATAALVLGIGVASAQATGDNPGAGNNHIDTGAASTKQGPFTSGVPGNPEPQHALEPHGRAAFNNNNVFSGHTVGPANNNVFSGHTAGPADNNVFSGHSTPGTAPTTTATYRSNGNGVTQTGGSGGNGENAGTSGASGAGGTGAASTRLSNNRIEARLRKEGYNSFTNVHDNNGYFHANARRYGKAVNNIKVSETTGRLQNQHKLNDEQVKVLLAEKGYKDILNVNKSNNHTITATAKMGGAEHKLYVDSLTGHVTQKS